jgi:7-keto-8-aminopelargonate synthetase-like enzyme
VPLLAGSAEAALAWAARAFADGVWAPAVRPPTVPEGSARLRLTPIATHRDDHLEHAIDVLVRAARGRAGEVA